MRIAAPQARISVLMSIISFLVFVILYIKKESSHYHHQVSKSNIYIYILSFSYHLYIYIYVCVSSHQTLHIYLIHIEISRDKLLFDKGLSIRSILLYSS